MTDPAHAEWEPSEAETNLRLQTKIDGDAIGRLEGFPVTMNGCGERQLRVEWESLDDVPVVAGYKFFTDQGDDEWVPEGLASPATSGELILSGCEEPIFQFRADMRTDDDGVMNSVSIAADVEVYVPR